MKSPADATPRRRLAAMRGRLSAARPALGLACALAAVAGGLPLAALSDDPGAATAPTPAAWQDHKFSFQYLGFTSTYSCDGLADKLRTLLRAAGARSDAKSQPGACASGFGRPDKFARADLTFATLAPLQGNPPPDLKRVNGTWRAVTIASNSPRELRVGDCELVEQFRSQVLPMFTTRNVESKTTCIPNQESGSLIDLKFEVFAPVAANKH